MLDVTILFLEGGHSSTAVGPMEVFGSAGVLWNALHGQEREPYFRVSTASIDGGPVHAEGPVRLLPEHAISAIRKTDLILVPSGGLDIDSMATRNAEAIAWMRKWRRKGAAIAGVCSGVALLADSGLLDGKRATTHWALAEEYARRYPKVRWQPEYMVTEDDNLFCCGGVNSALDLSLYLVEKYCGRDIAMLCAKSLIIEMPRMWQSGFAVLPLQISHHDDAIRRAEEWIHGNWQRDVRVDDLAARMGMSPRNFARRFKLATGETPLGYLHELRIAVAKRLLEDDYRTIQEVSSAVGYDDVAFFRNLFKRHTGASPSDYRRRFGRTIAAE